MFAVWEIRFLKEKMHRYTHKSAQVTSRKHCGIALLDYAGVMCHGALSALTGKAVDSMAGCAYVARLNSSIFTLTELPPVTAKIEPGALIVREEQFDFWQAYAWEAAKKGVICSVWQPEHSALAQEWVQRRAC
jgi:hypothetical protein